MANFYKEAKVDSVSQIKLLYIELRTWLQMVADGYIDSNNVDTSKLMAVALSLATEENHRLNKPIGQYADAKQAKFDMFERNSENPTVISQLKRMLADVMNGHPESFDTRKGSIFAIINNAKNSSTAGIRTYDFSNEIKENVAWFAPKEPIARLAGSDASTAELAKALTWLQENNKNVVCKFRMDQSGQNEWIIDGGVNGLRILLGKRGREFTRIDENGNRVIDEKGGRAGILQLCGITPKSMDLVKGRSTEYAIALSPAEGLKFAEAISDPGSKLRKYVMLTSVQEAKESATQTSLQLDDSADTNSVNNSLDEQIAKGHANMGNMGDTGESIHKEIMDKFVNSIKNVMSAVRAYVAVADKTPILVNVPMPQVSLNNEDLLVQSVSSLSSFLLEFAYQGGKGIKLSQRTCHYGGSDYPIVTVDEFKIGQLISKLSRINGLAFNRSLADVVDNTAKKLGSFFTNIERKLKKVFDSVTFSDEETDAVSTSEEAKARNALKKEYYEFMQTIPTGGKVRLIDMMSAMDTAYETDISADENAENEHNFKHIFKRMTQPVRDLYEKFNTLDYALSQGSATKEDFEQIKPVVMSLASVFMEYLNNHIRWKELSQTPVKLDGQESVTTIGKLVNELDKGNEYNIDPTLLPKVVDAFDVISQKLNVYGTQMTDQDWAIIANVAVKKKDKAKENEKEPEAEQPEAPPTADAPDTPAESDESDDLFTIDDDDEPMIDLDGGSNETATPSEPSEQSDPADDMVLRDDDDDDDDDDDGAIGHLTR
jgi:hypothetical protein